MRYRTAEEFGSRLAELLQIDMIVEISPHDNLYDDWGLDSLQGFQMLIITESMADCLVPPPDIPEIYSLSEAYDYYCSLLDTET